MSLPYRVGDPGQDIVVRLNFGRKNVPAGCVAPHLVGDNPKWGPKCGRVSVALCDAPAGHDLGGRALTCDALICEHHRVKGGPDIDYCPRHRTLAPAELPL